MWLRPISTATDSFTYHASDGSLNSGLATVTITINPLNDAPVATNNSYSVAEDGVLNLPAAGVLANDTDVDGDPLAAVLASGPANGSLTLNSDGSFIYTPFADFNGVDSFTYRANDGLLSSNLATVTITVNAANDAPTAAGESYSVSEDGNLAVPSAGLLANDSDIDGNPLTAILLSGPANGSLTFNADGSFTYTPNANFNGVDSFIYRANDGQVSSNLVTVTITVNPVNDAPVAANNTYSMLEDSVLVGLAGVLGNDLDVDGDPLTAVLVSGPASGSLTLNSNGTFNYTPAANFNGMASFTYRASDGLLTSNLATVTIFVGAVNDAPVAAGESYNVLEDGVLNVVSRGVLANDTDADGNPLTATLLTGPANGVLILNVDGSFTYTPNANFNGLDSFTYCANDGTLSSNLLTVTITVASVNDAPTAGNDSYVIAEDAVLTLAASGVLANDTDVEAQPLSPVLVSGPANGRLTLNADGSITYTPDANFSGTDSFTYRAADGQSTSSPATVTISVTPINDAPLSNDDTYAVAPDGVLQLGAAVLSNDVDVDGNALAAVLLSGASHGQLTLNPDGSFVYAPHAGYVGSDSFTYQASDGTLAGNAVTVTIQVGAVAPPPPVPENPPTPPSSDTGPLSDGSSGSGPVTPQPLPTIAVEAAAAPQRCAAAVAQIARASPKSHAGKPDRRASCDRCLRRCRLGPAGSAALLGLAAGAWRRHGPPGHRTRGTGNGRSHRRV